AHRRQDLQTLIANMRGRAEATSAGHVAGRALGAAAAAGRGPHAKHALREKAQLWIRQQLVQPLELIDAEIGGAGLFARRFIAQRNVWRQHGATWWQLAFQQSPYRRGAEFWCRRTAWHVVIDFYHLVERPYHVPELRQPESMGIVLELDLRADFGLIDHGRG